MPGVARREFRSFFSVIISFNVTTDIFTDSGRGGGERNDKNFSRASNRLNRHQQGCAHAAYQLLAGIIGARKITQFQDNLKSLEIT
jgi:hypothetical protein